VIRPVIAVISLRQGVVQHQKIDYGLPLLQCNSVEPLRQRRQIRSIARQLTSWIKTKNTHTTACGDDLGIEDPVVIRETLNHLQERSPLDSGLPIPNPFATEVAPARYSTGTR